MDDLISRAAAIEAATDWKVKPDGEIFNAIKAACRSKIEQIPAVDAVPVEWLEEQRDKLSEAWDEEWHEINGLIEQWHEEQEAGE